MSDSLQPHGLQHARLPCPSLSPGVCSNLCPLSQRCHSNISFSVVPFSSCLQSFPAKGYFPMSQFFTSGSFSYSISPSNEHSGLISFRIDWFDLLAVQGTLLQHHSSKASILWHSVFFMVQLSRPYLNWKKQLSLDRPLLVMFLLFNMLSRFLIAFLPRSKCLLISWLQSPSRVILEAKKIVCHCFHCFPIYLPGIDGTGCHDLSFLNVEF